MLAPDDVDVCFELGDLLVADETDLDRAGAMLLAIPAGHPRRDGTLGRLAELRGDPADGPGGLRPPPGGCRTTPRSGCAGRWCWSGWGRDAEATAELERLRAADPANAVVRARLAERYEAAGRLAEAEAELRALADASPGRPEGWRRLAAFCTRHGLAEKARAAEGQGQRRPRPARRARCGRSSRPAGSHSRAAASPSTMGGRPVAPPAGG